MTTIGSDVKLTAKNKELHNPVANLEADPTSIVRSGAYITKGTWQCDISQIAMRLRKDGQAGWLYFVEDTSPNT